MRSRYSTLAYASFHRMLQTLDGRHHGSDVVVGILIGTVAGFVGYLHCFYSPLSAYRGLPRCVRDTKGMPAHLLTEEMTKPLIPFR